MAQWSLVPPRLAPCPSVCTSPWLTAWGLPLPSPLYVIVYHIPLILSGNHSDPLPSHLKSDHSPSKVELHIVQLHWVQGGQPQLRHPHLHELLQGPHGDLQTLVKTTTTLHPLL